MSINQNTFATYETATLHVPEQSFNTYYWNTEWSQFRSMEAFDEPYNYFYLNSEYTLASRFKGNPLIDLNPGGGLIVEGDDVQDANNIYIHGSAGSDAGTIIANGNVNAENLYFDIRTDADRWYFFCFPFDIKRSNVRTTGDYVMRRYDGALRATTGGSGWTDLDPNDEWLHRGTGYIFQTSRGGTLTIRADKEQIGNLTADNGERQLATYSADNEQNASWNFIGNPQTSYFDMNDMNYDAPLTRWNGSTYEALRPGDDDYVLRPFEAFFVQKPSATASVEFDASKRLTKEGSQKRLKASKARRMARGVDAQRLIVNLTLSGEDGSDRTRMVFNAAKSRDYEIDCDAAKFDSPAPAPQLYTIEARDTRLAINERPMGSVQLGMKADKDGEYTIAATRMDTPMLLKDNLTGTTFDLAQGDYTFTATAGTCDSRFMLMPNNGTTGIADIAAKTGVSVIGSAEGIYISGAEGKQVSIYNTGGSLLATRTTDGLLRMSRGVYVVRVDGMSAKVMVK